MLKEREKLFIRFVVKEKKKSFKRAKLSRYTRDIAVFSAMRQCVCDEEIQNPRVCGRKKVLNIN